MDKCPSVQYDQGQQGLALWPELVIVHICGWRQNLSAGTYTGSAGVLKPFVLFFGCDLRLV